MVRTQGGYESDVRSSLSRGDHLRNVLDLVENIIVTATSSQRTISKGVEAALTVDKVVL